MVSRRQYRERLRLKGLWHIIQSGVIQDREGPFIPVCMHIDHEGVIGRRLYYQKKCHRKNGNGPCSHLRKYRLEE